MKYLVCGGKKSCVARDDLVLFRLKLSVASDDTSTGKFEQFSTATMIPDEQAWL